MLEILLGIAAVVLFLGAALMVCMTRNGDNDTNDAKFLDADADEWLKAADRARREAGR